MSHASDDLQVQSQAAGSATVETSVVYDATNPAWVAFDAAVDQQVASMEERFRCYWTMRTVRTSIGR